jgi:hypothetical protein
MSRVEYRGTCTSFLRQSAFVPLLVFAWAERVIIVREMG